MAIRIVIQTQLPFVVSRITPEYPTDVKVVADRYSGGAENWSRCRLEGRPEDDIIMG